MIPRAGHAQAQSLGVFSALQTVRVPDIGVALEPATMRSRVVSVDTQQVTAARRGREAMRLNLFDDAIVDVRIDRVRPTRSGYFISGRPEGMEWGEVRLVVNGPIVVGTVVTPEGKFTIRWDGSGRHVIRQIDPSAESFEDDEVEHDLLPAAPSQADSPIDPLSSIAIPATHFAGDTPTEDGSKVRVLIVYTPAMQRLQGGAVGMQALVDLMIHSTNHAFERSGIEPRLVLAHSALVDYVEERTTTDVNRLADSKDGYMDEVHALRNEHAADLVHLLTAWFSSPQGAARRFYRESVDQEDFAAFAVTGTDSEETFAHEIGHNFGLRHDRYLYSNPYAIYPYAFGYVNSRAFEPAAPGAARWRTVMSYPRRCADAAFSCRRLLRFSNPELTHEGDPLGVPADDPATGPDGPADARLTINRTARWVGSFRSEACTDFTVTPDAPVAPVGGGEVVLKVETAPGCLWEVSSQSGFLTPPSDARHAGTRFVSINVEANQTGAQRTGTLGVAGTSIEVRQLATDAGICGRTPTIVRAIAGQRPCDEVTDQHLSEITVLSVARKGLTSVKAGDFAGLSGLERLDLGTNRLAELPEDLFAGLTSLKTLHLGYNQLTQLPEGLFADLSSIESLDLIRNRLTDLPEGLFAGLSSLKVLDLGHNTLSQLSQNQFANLANLEELELIVNELSALPDELFVRLGHLKHLTLAHNQFVGWPTRAFTGLSELETLDLSHNRLPALPASAFAGLPKLKDLKLGGNPLTSLPLRLFVGLSDLEVLSFWNARLTGLPEGIFAGLSNLTNLDLYSNNLGELPPGLFAGLSRLSRLSIGGNELTTLPNGIFSGLTNLLELNLYRNQLSSLPAGVFSGLTSLEELSLSRNRVDPLPLSVSLEQVGNNQFKAVAPTGAPFALPVPVSSVGGTFEGNAGAVTIPAGAVESSPITVTRVPGAQRRVTVDIGTLPDLPGTHSGYVFEKGEALPLSVLPSIDMADATLSDLSLSDGTLDPVFEPDTTAYTASVPHAVASTTVTPATSNPNAAAAFHDGSDAALLDADANTDGHQVSLSSGDNVIKVVVTAENGTAVWTYTIVMTREASICNRTDEVVDAIVQAVSDVDSCGYVSNAHLAKITTLDLRGKGISSLQSGDFSGLSALQTLWLTDNQLTALPADIFSGLAALETLGLRRNQLVSLPDNVFSGLSELRLLYLTSNRLSSLPGEIFSGLSKLDVIWLGSNRIASLPANIFSGLSSLEEIRLGSNEWTNLPADVFAGLSGLRVLSLGANELTSLPPDVFAGLSSLTSLQMTFTRLTSLPADVFADLSALEDLWLNNNALTSLPAGVFSGLSALELLVLRRNRLTTLPDGLFAGLTNLREVRLEGNAVDPLLFSVSLKKAGNNQFKAVAPVGAPFVLAIPVSASSSGTIEGDVELVTIPIGAVESAPVGVSRVPGASEAVTVDIGTLPGLLGRHRGYVLVKDTSLPLSVLPTLVPADAALSGLSLSHGTLDPVFDPNTTSYTASVPHAVTSITVNVTPNDSQATLAYFDADDQELADADSGTQGYQADLDVGDNTVKVKVTSQDETATRTYVIVATRDGTAGVCGRTAQVRDAIVAAVTGVSACAEVTETHLAGITTLDLSSQSIASLQSGDFSGLSALETLSLNGNQLTALPDGLFAGLTRLGTVSLGGNTVNPMPLSVSLAKVGENQFKAVAPTGAPFALAVPVSSAAGTIDGSASSVTIPAGAAESPSVGVSRAPGVIEAVTVDIGTLPALPGAHSGYVLEKGATLPLAVFPPRKSSDTALSGLSLSHGTLDPVFDPDMSRYTASVPHAVASITVNATPRISQATLAYFDADDQELADADADTDGHQVSLSSGDNVIKVAVTSEDETLRRRYTIVMTREDSICDRTDAVVGAIVQAVSGVGSCGHVTSAHLAGITLLDLSGQGIASLQSGDFMGLPALQTLHLNDNQLTELPAGIFSLLDALGTLSLADNQLESLPVAVFSRLSALRFLYLNANRLDSLPNGTLYGLSKLEVLRLQNNRIGSFRANAFSGLSSLEELLLSDNELTSLRSAVFSGLSSLDDLRLDGNELASLPAGVFSGLSALQTLQLHSNRLSTLPDGLFAGLTNLGTLTLGSNTVNPMPLSVSLEKAGNNQFKAVAPTGAVFALELPLSVSSGGEIEGSADSITIPAGAVESMSLSVTRVAGAGSAVTMDIGTLPSLPSVHSGYELEKDTSLPLTVLPSLGSAETRLSDLSLSDGTLDPVFDPDTSRYTASVPHAVASITVTPATSNQNAAAAFHDGSDAALPDADANTDGHQVSLSSGENVIKVVVTAENGTSVRTYTLVMTRQASICTRTAQVVDAIVQAVSGVDSCGYVSTAHLADITLLDLGGESITSLQSGDFSGLSALETLHLHTNQLTVLPADIFSELAALENLGLWNNQLESLPANVFSGLSKLRALFLYRNRLTGLPDGIFSGLSSLEGLYLYENELTSLPAGVFSGLSALTSLQMNINALTSLPSGVFAGLSSLQTLLLNDNELTSLRADEFAGLSALQTLFLNSNAFTSLPAGLFSGLSALQLLGLSGNRLTTLPDGFFAGLTNLREVGLGGNTVNPMPLPVSLEKVGNNQFKAVAPTGALFAFELSLSVSSGGEIEGGADSITIPAGAVESGSLSVTRTYEAGPAVTVDIGALPQLPAYHYGYVLEKDASLPLSVLPSRESADAALSGLSLSHGTLAPVFASETTRYTASVPHAAASITVNATPRISQATLAYFDANDQELADAGTQGYQANLDVGDNTVKVKVTSQDETATRTYVIVVTRAGAGILCSRTAQVRDAIMAAVTGVSTCTEVTEAHLAGVTTLDLSSQSIASLQSGDFSGLSALETLSLNGNQLTALPDGLFAGLTSLGTLTLGGNTVNPMPLSVSLAKVGENRFKAVAPTGAPFALAVAVSSAGGTIDGGASSITIPAGAVESAAVGVSRAPSAIEAVTVDIGSLPALPGAHTGYVLVKDASLPLSVLPSRESADTALSGLSLSHGTLDPVFDLETTRYTASVPHAAASITVNVTPRNSQATLAYFDADDEELADADAGTEGYQADLDAGDNTVKVKVTSQDETATRTYAIVVTRAGAGILCSRTAQVRDAIVAAVSGVSACAEVTEAHLAGITTLDLNSQRITSLQSGDFAGLSALETLRLNFNQLTALPADVFAGLAALEYLELQNNQLQSVPGNVFSGLSALQSLWLHDNILRSLPSGVFSGLSSLERIRLNTNSLTSLPSDVFSGLSSLERIRLNGNLLASLPAGVFSGLSSLQTLWLHQNSFTSLPAGLFTGLSALGDLRLADNYLTTLPDGLFAGLTNLGTLTLGSNTVNPMPLSVSLAKVGENQFKAVAPIGAPFALAVAVSSAGGTVDGGASSITIPAGAVESAAVGVSRAEGDTEAVTVDIGTLPALPGAHSGYVLEKDTTLPRVILPATRAAPPAQVTGVDVTPGEEQLDVSWTAVSGAGGYKVQWKSGAENYDASRQAVITAGATTSHTITGLNAGTEYTMRVIATKANANDGPPSDEVTGTPRAVTPGQVTGLEVAAGTIRLVVSWTAVAGAGGYKVQWKSGEEDYATSRQAVIADGATTSHTITGLTAGTEYTVRVIATKEYADDGPTSDEVTGTPRAVLPGQVTRLEVSPSVELLDVSWTAVSDAGGYKVQWKSGEEDYATSRQAVIADGATTSHTITGLTAGTEHTVRVIATKENANDGPPSDEVTGTPRAVSPAQVTGLAVVPGTNRLVVSWTAVAGAGGYKVQWKSGEEDYVTSRQAVIADGATTSHTITGLTAGAEYSVRVIATKEYADDGSPSDGVKGTPLAVAVLNSFSLSDGTLDPAFASDTTSYKASVVNAVSSITVTVTTNFANATVAFVDRNDAALPDADANTDGHQVSLSSGDNVIKVVVTAEDGGSVRTYTLAMTREASICNRTSEVVEAIVQSVSGVDSCGYVSTAHLAGITTMDLSGESITSLQSGDFAGLSALQTLRLHTNQLTALPADVFAGLSALKYLELQNNQLQSVPGNVFSGLSALQNLWLHDNALSSLPSGVFSGLSSLERIYLHRNSLTSLSSGVFSGLSSLERIRLNGNGLTSLPSGVFSGLSSVEDLRLNGNGLTSLSSGVFSGLSSLQTLRLHQNALTRLPAGVFSGLSALGELQLAGNKLTTLPDGLFAGLTNLGTLTLGSNTVNPMPLSVSLEKVGNNQFKAVAPTGAPFALAVAVSSAGGTIDGSASSVTIPAGAVESASVGVSRAEGDTEAVTVDIGTLPALPSSHTGYALNRDSTLPRVILPATSAAPPAQVTGVVVTRGLGDPDVNGDGALDSNDALLMWHAFNYESLVGDGETGGTAESRQRLLAGYSGKSDPSDEDLQAVLRRANAWRTAGVNGGGDINADGMIDGSDARALYNAYAYESLLGDGEEGGAARFRSRLLGPLAGKPDPSDGNLTEMLRKANRLREEFN